MKTLEYKGYTITTEGRVFNRFGRELFGEKPKPPQVGYQRITFTIKGVSERWLMHRLIATLFIPNPNHLPYVNHIDGDKLNNRVENLEWVSAQDNTLHALATGLKVPKSTAGYGQGKSTAVLQVDPKTDQIIQEFPSMKQAAQAVGGDFQLISAVVNGKRKTHKGFKWVKK